VIRSIGAAVLCAVAIFGAAQELDLAPVTSLKVDLAKVTELGIVSPVDGVTSSGQPDEAALEVFADSGYATVIDLRGAGEDRGLAESAVVEDLGMHYVTLPIAGPEAISYENARKLDELIGQSGGPVLVHCGSGNRVGALLALRAKLHGADDESALQLGREGGLTRLEDVVRERLAEAPQ